MNDTNKNSLGIDSYLTAQKLFQKQRGRHPSLSHKHKNPAIQAFSHQNIAPNFPKSKYKYHLLNDENQVEKKNIHNHIVQEESSQNIEQQIIQQYQKRIQKPNRQKKEKSQQKRNRQHSVIHNQEHIMMEKSPFLEENKSPIWESVVSNTSRKYFESCRSQALSYIQKMSAILDGNKTILAVTIEKIRQYIKQNLQMQAGQLKQDLYTAVDGAVEKWVEKQIQKSISQEISYIGELFELTTQVEERIKQMDQYRYQMEDQRNWRKRASDLLTTNYEQDMVQLSKLCKKSTLQAKQHAQNLIHVKSNHFQHQIQEIGSQAIKQKMQQLIFIEILPQQKHLVNLYEQFPAKKSPKKQIKHNHYEETQQKIKNHRRQIFNSTNKNFPYQSYQSNTTNRKAIGS